MNIFDLIFRWMFTSIWLCDVNSIVDNFTCLSLSLLSFVDSKEIHSLLKSFERIFYFTLSLCPNRLALSPSFECVGFVGFSWYCFFGYFSDNGKLSTAADYVVVVFSVSALQFSICIAFTGGKHSVFVHNNDTYRYFIHNQWIIH